MKPIKIQKAHNFKAFKIWQESRVLVKDIYVMTKTFPNDEKFGITSQIRRAAVSICTNIAEGTGRDTEGQLLNFLNIAKGSSYETENLLILSNDLENFKLLELQNIKIQNMLYRFYQKIKNDQKSNLLIS